MNPTVSRQAFAAGKSGRRIRNIDVARVADGVLVDPGDPLGDGIATDHSVRDTGRIERGLPCAAAP